MKRKRYRAPRGRWPDERRVWTEAKHDLLAQLWCLEGLTYEEIAAKLDSTPAAVHAQIQILGLNLTPQAIQARRARGIFRGYHRPNNTSHEITP